MWLYSAPYLPLLLVSIHLQCSESLCCLQRERGGGGGRERERERERDGERDGEKKPVSTSPRH